MIRFRCSYQWDQDERDERDDWDGVINRITYFVNHYEIFITSRSSLRVLIGKHTYGLFACIPDYQAGCYLGALNDTFYNSEKLISSMENPVDGTTVACALKALSNVLKFD
jgi:hypothetical protein